jgi:hypothetical protein
VVEFPEVILPMEALLKPMLPGIPDLRTSSFCTATTEPDAVAARLSKLHPTLDIALLREVSEHGYRRRIEATDMHSTTAAGSFHWHESIFALRTMLSERGWKKEDLKNCPLIVSPDRKIALSLMTGDNETGWPQGNPSNQAQKGSVLETAVAKNQQQLKLFDAKYLATELSNRQEATQLWVVLYHVAVGTSGNTEIRMEVSLPSEFEKKRIVGWRERLILTPIAPDGSGIAQSDLPTAPIDVPIERRTGT